MFDPIMTVGSLTTDCSGSRSVPCQFDRLLEVGALVPDNYVSCRKWMDNTPIDLRSNHPDIKEQDFLKMDLDEHTGQWDLISLSLVVNFAPEPFDRGPFVFILYVFVSLKLPCPFLKVECWSLPTPCLMRMGCCSSRFPCAASQTPVT